MGQKIITEEDFWICTEGAIPTQFQGTRESLHNLEGKKYITKEDKSTVGWLDFGCKKYMLLAALVAAVAVVAAVAIGVLTVATGGAGLIILGAIAGVVGGAIGAVVGGLLCGQKMAAGREWLDCKNNMILQGSPTITGEHIMQCKAGGIIRYAPNIKSWTDAISYATLSYTSELVKCAFAGAAVGTVGTLLGVGAGTSGTTGLTASVRAATANSGGTLGTGINLAGRAMTIAKPTIGSIISNIGASFGIGTGATGAGIALGSRGIFGAESAAYTYATGGINKNGEEAGVLDEFAKGASPEYEFGSRIAEHGLSGLQPTDALFLLYFLNIKADPPGTYRDGNGTLRNARGNTNGKPPGSYAKDPRTQNAKPQNGKPYEDGDRPSWRQSEIDVENMYEGYDTQKSFKDGKEVTYGTEGSTRPDMYKPGHSIEVKNYNLETSSGRRNMQAELTRQYNQRLTNLPQGTKQTAVVDVRGQNVSPQDLVNIEQNIVTSCPDLEVIFIQ